MSKLSGLVSNYKRTTVTRVEGIILLAELKDALALPESAELFITVPGGGDWSNARMSIGEHIELQVVWETTECDGQ